MQILGKKGLMFSWCDGARCITCDWGTVCGGEAVPGRHRRIFFLHSGPCQETAMDELFSVVLVFKETTPTSRHILPSLPRLPRLLPAPFLDCRKAAVKDATCCGNVNKDFLTWKGLES